MKARFCQDCGTTAKPKKRTPGSFCIELLLWVFFILPGLIYSLWRLSARHPVCRLCGSPRLIPAHSPAALEQGTNNR